MDDVACCRVVIIAVGLHIYAPIMTRRLESKNMALGIQVMDQDHDARGSVTLFGQALGPFRDGHAVRRFEH
jgi:hypothetical protein